MEYRPRIVDALISEALGAAGAVVIEGPKACGKTETGRRLAASEIRMDSAAAREMFAAAPNLVLEGATPRLVDEWQVEDDLWNLIRHEVDDRQTKGQFILTGSAVPADDPIRHTGAGRFIRLRMRPMALAEAGYSSGDISLAAIMRGESVTAQDPGLTVSEIAERIVVGGWPANMGLTPRQSLRVLSGYIEDLCRVDVQRLGEGRRDPQGVRRLIASLARNVGTPAKLTKLTTDANGEDGTLTTHTVSRYLDALTRLMVSDDVPAWAPEIRSRIRLQGAPVRHLADPSLATAALQAAPDRLLGPEIKWMGFLFESLVVRDLRVYGESLDARMFHLRDDKGYEVDAIIELPDGTWAAFEVKLGSTKDVIDAAAANLLHLKERYRSNPPIALAVITGTGHAFPRKDGVLRIPIGTLAA